MTIEQIYKEYLDQLKNIYDGREAANIVDWVVENITGMKRIERTLNKHTQLSNTTIEQLNSTLKQLLQHKPVQYVLGEAWFYKMKLYVNEHVLIPRPETEELVEWIVEDVRTEMYDVRSSMYDVQYEQASSFSSDQTLNILDIGTGSGCIAIALKKELVNSNILGIDISAEALSVAKRNAIAQNLNVDLLLVDFLNKRNWNDLATFNIIASNPPYIPEKEKNTLKKNVIMYEPHTALFVSDVDPFVFYRKMAEFASDHLTTKGKIYAEVHEKYAGEIVATFLQYHFTSIIKKDMYGRERMICAQR